MFCAKCGNEIKTNESFCPNCGATAVQAGAATPSSGHVSAGNRASKVAGLGRTLIAAAATVIVVIIGVIVLGSRTGRLEGTWRGEMDAVTFFSGFLGVDLDRVNEHPELRDMRIVSILEFDGDMNRWNRRIVAPEFIRWLKEQADGYERESDESWLAEELEKGNTWNEGHLYVYTKKKEELKLIEESDPNIGGEGAFVYTYRCELNGRKMRLEFVKSNCFLEGSWVVEYEKVR